MAVVAAGKEARVGTVSASGYVRQCPEQTLLYQLVEQHYAVFVAQPAFQGRSLAGYVRRESAIIGEGIFHLTIRRFDVEVAFAHHRKGNNRRQRVC